MKATADTNVLVRAMIEDSPTQTPAAKQFLADAELVAVSNAALCETAWVLTQVYKRPRADVALAIRALLETHKVVIDRSAADAGLAALEAGGDFADGVIAFEGRALGGDTFVSFDKQAVKQLQALGHAARLL